MSNCYCGDVYCRGGCKKADPFEAIKPSPHRPDLRLEEPMSDTPLPDDLLITVCDACLQASCWQAKFFCENAQSAGTVDLPVKRLLGLNREHPSYWLNDPRAKELR